MHSSCFKWGTTQQKTTDQHYLSASKQGHSSCLAPAAQESLLLGQPTPSSCIEGRTCVARVGLQPAGRRAALPILWLCQHPRHSQWAWRRSGSAWPRATRTE